MNSRVLETYCFCISLWEIHKFMLHIYVCIDRETMQILADIQRLLQFVRDTHNRIAYVYGHR